MRDVGVREQQLQFGRGHRHGHYQPVDRANRQWCGVDDQSLRAGQPPFGGPVDRAAAPISASALVPQFFDLLIDAR